MRSGEPRRLAAYELVNVKSTPVAASQGTLMAHPVVFLKMGGSLITEKSAPTRLARRDLIDRLMQAVAEARAQRPQMRLVLAHGAGSFGHVEAKRHGTRAGVSSAQDWMGFLEVQVR